MTECIGPRGLGGPRSPGHREHRDIPFGPIAEKRESSPILGSVFKLQRMRNRKQILQKREAALPDASSRQPRVKERDESPHSAALLPRFIRDKQRKSLDPFRCDTEFIQSRDMRTLKVSSYLVFFLTTNFIVYYYLLLILKTITMVMRTMVLLLVTTILLILAKLWIISKNLFLFRYLVLMNFN